MAKGRAVGRSLPLVKAALVSSGVVSRVVTTAGTARTSRSTTLVAIRRVALGWRRAAILSRVGRPAGRRSTRISRVAALSQAGRRLARIVLLRWHSTVLLRCLLRLLLLMLLLLVLVKSLRLRLLALAPLPLLPLAVTVARVRWSSGMRRVTMRRTRLPAVTRRAWRRCLTARVGRRVIPAAFVATVKVRWLARTLLVGEHWLAVAALAVRPRSSSFVSLTKVAGLRPVSVDGA